MKIVNSLIVAVALVCLGLGFANKLHTLGGHGMLVLGAAALAGGLVGMHIPKGYSPRWASGVALVAFLIIGMKTSDDNSGLQNIMMAAFVGMVLSLVVLIRPGKRA